MSIQLIILIFYLNLTRIHHEISSRSKLIFNSVYLFSKFYLFFRQTLKFKNKIELKEQTVSAKSLDLNSQDLILSKPNDDKNKPKIKVNFKLNFN